MLPTQLQQRQQAATALREQAVADAKGREQETSAVRLHCARVAAEKVREQAVAAAAEHAKEQTATRMVQQQLAQVRRALELQKNEVTKRCAT